MRALDATQCVDERILNGLLGAARLVAPVRRVERATARITRAFTADSAANIEEAQQEGIIDGQLQRREYVRSYYPILISGRVWRAIAWTTSASVCAVIELVNSGDLPATGFLKQEHIPLELFMQSRNGGLYEAEPRR